MNRLRTGDRGSAAMEIAVVALPMLLVTFMVVQAALVYYARATALAAATQGANAARAYGAGPTAGQQRANDFLDRVGGGLRGHTISMTTTGTDVTITVSGHAPTVLPWMTFDVSQSASGPIERFVP